MACKGIRVPTEQLDYDVYFYTERNGYALSKHDILLPRLLRSYLYWASNRDKLRHQEIEHER